MNEDPSERLAKIQREADWAESLGQRPEPERAGRGRPARRGAPPPWAHGPAGPDRRRTGGPSPEAV